MPTRSWDGTPNGSARASPASDGTTPARAAAAGSSSGATPRTRDTPKAARRHSAIASRSTALSRVDRHRVFLAGPPRVTVVQEVRSAVDRFGNHHDDGRD